MKKIVILSLFLISSTLLLAHPIKMTTGRLEINTDDKTCLLTLNFFIDDFEKVLQEIYPLPKLDFRHPDEITTETIQLYIIHNFDLLIDKKLVQFSINKIEQIESNVCQVSLSGDIYSFDQFELATIKNTLFFAAFSKQSNIVHLIINDKSPQILQFYEAVPVRIISM